MTSRATGMRPQQPKRWWERKVVLGRDFPADHRGYLKGVCRRCGLVMHDVEPHGATEFWHIASPHQTRALACANSHQKFDERSPEVEPFMRKGRRRALRRQGIRP